MRNMDRRLWHIYMYIIYNSVGHLCEAHPTGHSERQDHGCRKGKDLTLGMSGKRGSDTLIVIRHVVAEQQGICFHLHTSAWGCVGVYHVWQGDERDTQYRLVSHASPPPVVRPALNQGYSTVNTQSSCLSPACQRLLPPPR